MSEQIEMCAYCGKKPATRVWVRNDYWALHEYVGYVGDEIKLGRDLTEYTEPPLCEDCAETAPNQPGDGSQVGNDGQADDDGGNRTFEHPSNGGADSLGGEWVSLGQVTISTGTLLLIDPAYGEVNDALDGSDFLQVPIAKYRSAVMVSTGIGDGRYLVEGRFVDCFLGQRLAEIRVRFLDEHGNYLGGDAE